MYYLLFTEMTHCKYATTKNRQCLFCGKISVIYTSAFYFFFESVALIVKILNNFVLFGTDVGER